MKYRVSEIFDSIEGEGKRAGDLATFIRLIGCNLNCGYCDSRYTFHGGEEMDVEDIIKRVTFDRVTLTGGEPLIWDVAPLLDLLWDKQVNVETNGSRDISRYFKYGNVFFTVDWKCGTSGMSSHMLPDNFYNLRPQDVLKFVVGSIGDLEEAERVCKRFKPKCPVYISPVFEEIEPRDIVEFMKAHKKQDWKIQLQLHKFIWEPNRRGV